MEEKPVEERREAFRVDVHLPLLVRDIPEEGDALPPEGEGEGAAEGLKTQEGSEGSAGQGLPPEVWTFLKGLEKKLDWILERLPTDIWGAPAQEVNLSTSGMRFRHRKPFKPDQSVRVKMILYTVPSQEIILEGKVVRVQPRSDGYHEVALCFSEMNEETRKVLFQYLLSQQRKELAAKRQNDHDKDSRES